MSLSKPDITELVVRQAAALAATGASISDLATQLNISRHAVRKIMALDEFKAAVREISEEAMTVAKQTIRTEMGGMAREVVRVIKERLRKDDLEAVKVALKVIGFDQEEQVKADTHIQVVLPGKVENVIETSGQTVSETEDPSNV